MEAKLDVHKMNIYRHSATTVDPKSGAMMRYFANHFGNPKHPPVRPSGQGSHAREQTAVLIGAAPGEIVFTGGGTEADNLALLGPPRLQSRGKPSITSAVDTMPFLTPANT